MTRKSLVVGFTVMGLAMASGASAAPLTLEGLFVKVGIGDRGTVGSNGTAAPGMQHDPTGTGTFNNNRDYLTPGTPHESFAVEIGGTVYVNDNNGGSPMGSGAPAVNLFGGYDNAAVWTGGVAGLFAITNQYYFNDGDERLNIQTTITALADLDNVSFGRSVDPDPDQILHGTFDTHNTRGTNTIAKEDIVTSRGVVTGNFLGLLNLSGNRLAHNTGISDFFGAGCCSADEPSQVLPGYGAIFPAVDTADYGLQMAWLVGDLVQGETATINYAYVFGDNLDDVRVDPVPEPATMALMSIGLVGIGFAARRRKAQSQK